MCGGFLTLEVKRSKNLTTVSFKVGVKESSGRDPKRQSTCLDATGSTMGEWSRRTYGIDHLVSKRNMFNIS